MSKHVMTQDEFFPSDSVDFFIVLEEDAFEEQLFLQSLRSRLEGLDDDKPWIAEPTLSSAFDSW